MADNETINRISDELSKIQKKITGLGSKLTDFTALAGQLFTGISDAAGSLAQSNRISSQGINQFTGQVKDSSISFSKNIANYSNLVSQGLGREALELGSLNETMTLFGVNVAAGNRLTRLNSQALGLSTSEAASLTKATIQTAIEYGVGVDAMVNALNQMSSTLIKVGVEFGKDAAVGLESATAELIGKVGQEFAGTATKFAGQLFTGLDGLQRRAFLGIQGQELTPEALAKALSKLTSLKEQAGGTGTGVTAVVEAMQQQFGFGADIFALADAIANPTVKSETQIEQLEQQTKLNNALTSLTKITNDILMYVAPFAVSFANAIASLLTPLKLMAGVILAMKALQIVRQASDRVNWIWRKTRSNAHLSLLRKISHNTGVAARHQFRGGLLPTLGRFLPIIGAVSTIFALPSLLGLNSKKEQEIAQAQVEEQKKTNSLLTEDIVNRTQTDALLAVKAQSAAMLLRLDSITESSRRSMEDGTRRTRIGEETQDLLKSNSTVIDFMTDQN